MTDEFREEKKCIFICMLIFTEQKKNKRRERKERENRERERGGREGRR